VVYEGDAVSGGDTGRYRAVIADDEKVHRRALRRILQDSGRFEVVATANNGVQAVQAVREHKPDLLLLDVAMPVMHGLAALPRARAVSPATSVVMFSVYSTARLGRLVTARGAAGYFEKSTAPEQLVSDLLAVMSRRKARR
jgi:DNA-binding NarL/FixJ family response regulator